MATLVASKFVQAGLWLKPVGLVQRSAATWRCFCIHRVNPVNSRNGLTLSHDDSTVKIILVILFLL